MCYYIKIGGEKMVEFCKEEKIIFQLLKNSLNGDEKKVDFSGVDFYNLLKIADRNAVNMFVFDKIPEFKSLIDEEVYMKWLYLASRKLTIRENVLSVQKKLTALLEKNNINYFVFKGFCSAYYYKKAELRETGDIDFYVDFSDFETANNALIENGIKLISTDDEKHWCYELDGVTLEMHHDFWDLPENNAGNFIKDFLKNAINNVKKYNFDGYCSYGPDEVTHALLLVLHFVNHIQRGGIGLRHLCDFSAYFSSDDYKNNLDKVLDTFSKAGLLKTAKVLSKISNKYFDLADYGYFSDIDDEFCDLLLKDVVTSGNFGKNSLKSRYGSSAFTMNTAQEGSAFKSLSNFCKIAWKPCEKHSFLLVIAPFYIGIRYVFRVICGKRPKINPIKLTKSSVERVDLYKKLELFKEN